MSSSASGRKNKGNPTKKTMNKVANSTITNLAYIAAGIALLLEDPQLLPMGVTCFILGVASGIHHYYLHNDKWNHVTQRFDYFGMYAVFMAAILIYFQLGNRTVLLAAIPAALWLAWIATPNPLYVGLLGGGAAVGVALASGMAFFLHVTAWAAVGFAFRQIAEKGLPKQEDFLHGVGWHIPTAWMIYLIGIYIIR